MATVQLCEIVKKFGSVCAVDHLSLDIRDGEFVTFLGPSGCGKTTTLNCVAGLERVDAGEIRIDGVPVTEYPPRDRNVAVVFQDYALYPHMSVRDNVAFGLRMRRVDKREIDVRVEDVSKALGLTELLDRRPAELSGGQRQRVALGRAIAREPVLFLMDEPLSNLDAALRVSTRSEIKALHMRLGTTTIYVTHDQEEAMVLSDRVAIMRDGLVQQFASPMEAYARPANLFVAGFIGSPRMNLLEGTVAIDDGDVIFTCDGLIVRSDPVVLDQERDVLHTGVSAMLGIRPEHVTVSAAGGDYHAEVLLTERTGPLMYVTLQLPIGTIVAICQAEAAFNVGDQVGVSFSRSAAHYFDLERGERL
jgi:ABC-type sugar transport system ATPase subunit